MRARPHASAVRKRRCSPVAGSRMLVTKTHTGTPFTKTHTGTPCLLSGEPGQNEFSIDAIIRILIVDILYEICEYITLARFQVNHPPGKILKTMFAGTR